MGDEYLLDSEANKKFLKSMTENLLQFGRRFPSPEGASYYLGDDGIPWKDRNRETWITCRMAHVYSIGHMLGYPHCGELADCALKGLNGILHDKKNGGWNADGAPGIVYTTDWEGKPVVHDRMHWTLAEAINSSAVLYRITKKKKYADDYGDFMKYLDDKVIDHINGSWFHQLDQDNHLLDTVWPGKSDLYHAFQATLIPYMPVNISVAASVRF